MTDIISQNLSKKEAVATTTCWKMEMDVIFCKDLAFKIPTFDSRLLWLLLDLNWSFYITHLGKSVIFVKKKKKKQKLDFWKKTP